MFTSGNKTYCTVGYFIDKKRVIAIAAYYKCYISVDIKSQGDLICCSISVT